MALESVWYFTDLPKTTIDEIERDLFEKCSDELGKSHLENNRVNDLKRKSTNAWVPTHHWIGGFLWHYVHRVNRENFNYDITAIDTESLQYTMYNPGDFYGWHIDGSISKQKGHRVLPSSGTDSNNLDVIVDHISPQLNQVRKISFVLQLSDPDYYEGGNLQFLDENGDKHFCPRQRGTLVFFDSRIQHRVLKVKSGRRKSIVGWVVGPQWR